MDGAVASFVAATDADYLARCRSCIQRFDPDFLAELKYLVQTDRGFFRATYLIALGHCLTGTTSRCGENDDAWCDLGLAALCNDSLDDGCIWCFARWRRGRRGWQQHGHRTRPCGPRRTDCRFGVGLPGYRADPYP